MCSLNLNSIIDQQIQQSGNQRQSIERKMGDLAFAASPDNPGLLDALHTHRKRMPPALRGIRKHSVGYHRLYYSGHHTNCHYDACYLLIYKRGDNRVELDDDKGFQKHLKTALANKTTVRVLEDPTVKAIDVPKTLDETPDWQKADWYSEQKNYEEGE